jgi:hypothetical protein
MIPTSLETCSLVLIITNFSLLLLLCRYILVFAFPVATYHHTVRGRLTLLVQKKRLSHFADEALPHWQCVKRGMAALKKPSHRVQLHCIVKFTVLINMLRRSPPRMLHRPEPTVIPIGNTILIWRGIHDRVLTGHKYGTLGKFPPCISAAGLLTAVPLRSLTTECIS